VISPVRVLALFLCGILLSACAAPMAQREAVTRANRSLADFCRQAPCGPAKLVKAA